MISNKRAEKLDGVAWIKCRCCSPYGRKNTKQNQRYYIKKVRSHFKKMIRDEH